MSVFVLDSGAGGLGVLKRLIQLSPDRDYVYFADKANFPYGEKSLEFLSLRANEIFLRLNEILRFELAVIACNTLTLASADGLREKLGFPVVGVEPALLPAVKAFPQGTVYLFSTTFTSSSGRLSERFQSVLKRTRIFPLPELATLIEEGAPYKKLFGYLTERARIEEKGAFPLVLGCTHYPLVKEVFREVYPQAVLFDGTEGTARNAVRMLFGKTNVPVSQDAVSKIKQAFSGAEVFFKRDFCGKTPVLFIETTGKTKNSKKMSDLFALYYCKDCLFTV